MAGLTARYRRRFVRGVSIDMEPLATGCPASSSWQIFGLGKVGDQRIGQAEVDVPGPVPGQRLVGTHGVVLDPVVLGVCNQVPSVGDLFEEQLLVLQRSESAFA